jgi:hypothetical protein
VKVPRGFGAAYRECAADPVDEETLSDILALVGYDASPEEIHEWPLDRRVEAEVWAARVHLRASDNPIRVPPRPEWMPAPWLGPSRGKGIFGGPAPTPLTLTQGETS